MNDVADAAGVTKPVLYQHFESKRELYQALLDTVGARMVKAIRTATADVTSGRERTERGFRAYFRWVAANPEAFVLMYGGASRQDQEFAQGVRRVTDEAARAIAPLIDGVVDDEHRMNLAHALIGVSEAVSRRLVEQGAAFEPDVVADQLSSFAWAGLRSVTQPVGTSL